MALYDYQKRAVDSTWAYCRNNAGNPCIVIPTGGGKTHVMAQMIADCLRWKKRVIVAAHTIELMRQLRSNLETYGVADESVGYYSHSAGLFESQREVVLATIQSIYSKSELFGRRDVIFIDECHRVNPTDDETQYRRFFNGFPGARIIGLTATPYRLGSGLICDEGSIFSAISCEVSIRELLFSDPPKLCKLRSKWVDGIDTSTLSINCGEFSKGDEQRAFDEVLETVCVDMQKRCDGRKSIIVFCSGVQHCYDVSSFLWDRFRETARVVEGDTPDDLRREMYDGFRGGSIRWLVNYGVLTEGFDAKNIDAVVLQRATTSPGLYYQMAGRGLRLYPGKSDCLVLDYGENIARHGPIDMIEPGKRSKRLGAAGEAPVKACPQCKEAVPIQSKTCEICGYEWPVEVAIKIKGRASNKSIISDGENVDCHRDDPENKYKPFRGANAVLHARRSDGKEIVKVSYYALDPFDHEDWFADEYKDFENEGTREWVSFWWRKWKIYEPMPETNKAAVATLNSFLATKSDRLPTAIYKYVKPGGNADFPEIRFSFAKKHRREAIEATK
jgi:DNA repair protein RadD